MTKLSIWLGVLSFRDTVYFYGYGLKSVAQQITGDQLLMPHK